MKGEVYEYKVNTRDEFVARIMNSAALLKERSLNGLVRNIREVFSISCVAAPITRLNFNIATNNLLPLLNDTYLSNPRGLKPRLQCLVLTTNIKTRQLTVSTHQLSFASLAHITVHALLVYKCELKTNVPVETVNEFTERIFAALNIPESKTKHRRCTLCNEYLL
ncbi:hypothetical protein ANN_19992 [Periplaneta americana]|uniref:Uncharacterized protein n=1 Tax=Periplaneta americana TaxID=6978 RepID=A0ABQ8SBL9_PERAM|nr:hypothetical protein ANN_19992 [Periplaneta americana]